MIPHDALFSTRRRDLALGVPELFFLDSGHDYGSAMLCTRCEARCVARGSVFCELMAERG